MESTFLEAGVEPSSLWFRLSGSTKVCDHVRTAIYPKLLYNRKIRLNYQDPKKIWVITLGIIGTDPAPGQRASRCRDSEGVQVGALRMILYLKPEKIQEGKRFIKINFKIIKKIIYKKIICYTTEPNISACCKTNFYWSSFQLTFVPWDMLVSAAQNKVSNKYC